MTENGAIQLKRAAESHQSDFRHAGKGENSPALKLLALSSYAKADLGRQKGRA
jgi:hypothetical protein